MRIWVVFWFTIDQAGGKEDSGTCLRVHLELSLKKKNLEMKESKMFRFKSSVTAQYHTHTPV